jgi:tetratricopeptide (TPR) repeat protein
MKAHAGLGDQGMVSATYQRCVEALERELGLDPSPETRKLYEQIIREESEDTKHPQPSTPSLTVQRPGFLKDEEQDKFEKPIFVARETELSQLEDFLNLALGGKGQVVFITGDAGSGKSSLIQEFTYLSQEFHPNLIVASGNCNAHTGIGDPYLPFREILGLLTGDVEARWAGGTIMREHALRLWNLLPLATNTLVENGPDLINTFVPGHSLINRVRSFAPEEAEWVNRMQDVSNRQEITQFVPNLQQNDLFDQYTRVLRTLSAEHPLVLVLDDLQWADTGSVGLLFHLGRELTGSPILILGAYRQEEITMGRDGGRHPLEPVVNEFQREFGAISVNLGQADRRKFVEALLDSEPNQLGPSFREMLHRQTQGHPLFTIELLRGMMARGDVVRDKNSVWVESSTLDWETLPARVEAVIAERIGRLDPALQAILQVACVEGEVFTAEVLACVLESNERALLVSLSGELDRQHRLIRADSIHRMGDQLLSNYRFRNILFQKYLYSTLDQVERVHLHEQVGTVLEQLASDHVDFSGVALNLARHFEEAGIPEKAIYYLHHAGERAIQLTAYHEGITHLSRGFELLPKIPDLSIRDSHELTLQLSLAMAWKYNWTSLQSKEAITRARELSQQLGMTDQLSRVLGELCIYHYVHAEYHQAIEWAHEALSLAQQEDDPILIAEGNWYLGFLKYCLGDYETARAHLKCVLDFYDPQQHHHSLVSLRGTDAGLSAMAYDACCLWCLGYPDQAMKRSQEALALAREFNHTFTLADVLCYAGCMFSAMLRDEQTLLDCAEALIQISNAKGLYLSGWSGMATNFMGVALTMQGKGEEAITYIQESLNNSELSGVRLYDTISRQSMANAQVVIGKLEEGLTNLEDAMIVMEQTGDRNWEAELHRTRGELLRIQGDDEGAESCITKAIEVSQSQAAKSWELRASMGLANLWQMQGKVDEARELLEPIYSWFTEGFDTPDLKDAKALLKKLA